MSYTESDVIALAVRVNRAAAYHHDRSNEAVEASRKLADATRDYNAVADEWRKAVRALYDTDMNGDDA